MSSVGNGASSSPAGGGQDASDVSRANLKADATDSLLQTAEKLVLSFLALFDVITAARVLLKSPQEANLLVVPIPGQAAPPKDSDAAKPEFRVKQLQVRHLCTESCLSFCLLRSQPVDVHVACAM